MINALQNASAGTRPSLRRVAGFATLLLCTFTFATPCQPPPTGDVEVFYAFLRYQSHIVEEIQKKTAESPADGQAMERAAASLFGVTLAEFTKINPAYLTLRAELQALDSEGLTYITGLASKKQAPDIAVLRQLESRRQAILNAARAKLQLAFSASSWNSLIAYVDGQLRPNIKRIPIK